jgi:hypothetical protein
MMKKRAVFLILFVVGMIVSAGAEVKSVLVLEDILDARVAEELRKELKITRTAVKEDAAQLLLFPKTELGKKAPALWNESKPPYFTGELLYLVKKTTSKNDIETASLVCRAISTMEGIQYYSNTRKRVETLYPFCYMIDNPVSKNRIPDASGVIEDKPYYIYQHDLSLGKHVYSLRVSQTETEIETMTVNLDSIKVFLFTAVKEQNLKTYILISDVGTDFLMYVLVQSVFPATASLANSMTKSLTSRADALAAWFNDNYQKAR